MIFKWHLQICLIFLKTAKDKVVGNISKHLALCIIYENTVQHKLVQNQLTNFMWVLLLIYYKQNGLLIDC